MDKKFKIFVIVALMVLSGSVATGVGVVLRMSKETNSDQTKVEEVNKNLTIMNLNAPIIANLSDKGKVRISVALEVDSKDKAFKNFSEQFESNQLIIRDKIIGLLRNQTNEKLSQPNAQQKLAEVIKEEINLVFDISIINKVYFSEFFVD